MFPFFEPQDLALALCFTSVQVNISTNHLAEITFKRLQGSLMKAQKAGPTSGFYFTFSDCRDFSIFWQDFFKL